MSLGMIPAKQLFYYAGQPECTVIDLRDRVSYNAGHIPGAVSMTYTELMKSYRKLSKDKTYVLYCEHGGTSLMAAREMASEGFNVLSAAGGFLACGQQKKRLY